MRKLLFCCAAVAAFTPLQPVSAHPPGSSAWPAQEALAFCRDVVASEPDVKLGECMAYFESSDTGNLTQSCHFLDAQGVLDELGITFSQCVRLQRED